MYPRTSLHSPKSSDSRSSLSPPVRYPLLFSFSLLSFARFNYNPSLSTDYVFDGTSPPYVPSAEPNPLNLYSITKRDAELAVLGVEGAHVVVLRVPILCAFLRRPSQ
jgi:RmlD substrate binding domain